MLRAYRRRDLMTRSQRAVRWLQPGLVVKRWVLTSGLGLMMALLGAAVWADLKPIYWILETLSWFLSTITTVLPREVTGPLVLIIGTGLVLWGQSRSFGAIQQALAPDKDTVLVDALRTQSRLNRGPNIVAIGGGTDGCGVGDLDRSCCTSEPLGEWLGDVPALVHASVGAPDRIPAVGCGGASSAAAGDAGTTFARGARTRARRRRPCRSRNALRRASERRRRRFEQPTVEAVRVHRAVAAARGLGAPHGGSTGRDGEYLFDFGGTRKLMVNVLVNVYS